MNRNSNNPKGDINQRKPTVMKTKTVLKFLAGGLLAFVAADLQAQLLYKTKFSAVEGYTNGWCIGQPSIGNKWINANYDLDWVRANGDPATYGPLNNGAHSTNADGSIFYNVTATNCTAPGGGQMMIAADNNQKDIWPEDFLANISTYFFKMDFPNQKRGPVTVTWDWQFMNTNEVPADFDPTNNPHAELPGFDHGFTLSDWANRTAQEDSPGNPNWKYGELSTGVRLSSVQDCRYNSIGTCGGGGSWFDKGPPFKDYKVLHMKQVVYLTNGYYGDLAYVNTYDNWAQRDGEDLWQTASHALIDDWGAGLPWEKPMSEFGCRRCPGEVDPASGLNCIMLWLNGQVKPKYVLISNIRVVGPDPVAVPTVSIAQSGGNVTVTFTPGSWLEAKSTVPGAASDWTTVSVQSPYVIPASSAAQKFFRAVN